MADAATAEAEAETAGAPADASALLGNELVAEMPKVEPASVAQGLQETAGKQADSVPAAASAAPAVASAGSVKPPTDVDGRTFDPLIHETTADGQPVLRTDGRHLKKRRKPLSEYKTTSTMGELPAEGAAAAAGETAAAAPSPQDDAKAEQMVKASAATMAGVQLAMMRLALGPKCGTEEQEREGLMACWEDVLRYHGVSQVNPWIGLAMVSGMVAFKAVHQPENETNVQKLRHWFQRKALGAWQWLSGKRAAKPEAEEREAEPRA